MKSNNKLAGCIFKLSLILIVIGLITWGMALFMPKTFIQSINEAKEKLGGTSADTVQVDSVQAVVPQEVKTDLVKAEGTVTVNLVSADGIRYIEAVVCDDIPMRFILDTGCTGLQLGPIEYYYLVKQGKFDTPESTLDSMIVMNADGEVSKRMKIKIPSISVGGRVVRDVEATISPAVHAPALLGQNILEGLGSSVMLDYKKNTLTIVP